MTKTLAAILIAVAIGLSSNAPAADDPRDLWIGVVGFRDPYQNYQPQGSTALDPSTVLEPVAALVGGKWWFTPPGDEAYEALQKLPAQWRPPGTALPSSWQAHLFNTRRVRLRTAGPLHRLGEGYDAETLVVDTNLKLPRAKPADDDGDAQGIAVAGNGQVQFFTDLDASVHAELLRFLSERMLEVERAEIRRKAAEGRGIANAFPNDVDTKLLISQLASKPRRTNHAKTASQQDGRVYVIEGAKIFEIRDVYATLFTGAAARRDRNGGLHLLGAWSYLDANEWAHENRPLAVVERNGRSCWLIAHAQEGGQTYSLAKPGQIAPTEFTSTCDIE